MDDNFQKFARSGFPGLSSYSTIGYKKNCIILYFILTQGERVNYGDGVSEG